MHPIWNLPVPGVFGPSDKIILFDDFLPYSGSATVDASRWFETIGTSGTVASLDTVTGGQIAIGNGTATETGIEPNGAGFSVPASGKELYFELRAHWDTVVEAEVETFFGLATANDVAPIAAATNRVGFFKNVSSGVILTVIDATETASSPSRTAVAATFARYALKIRDGKVTYWVDLEDGNGPTKVGTATAPAAGTILMPKIFVGAGTGAADITFTVDYILVTQDR